jgi:flagellar biosynthesis protein FliR
MLLLSLPTEQVLIFFFVLVRVSTILFTIPFLSSNNVPALVKMGLAIAVSWLLLPQIDVTPPALTNSPINFVIGLMSEVAIGMIIGLVVQLLFMGVQLAGNVAGFQMGFAIANVVDPASSAQIPLLSQFLNLFAIVLFISFNAHYYFIKALVDGFEIIPLWGAHLSPDLFHLIIALTGNAFLVAVKIGAPVMVSLLLTSVALGLIARTVPQMQVFIVAMPLKIILGLTFFGLSLPYCASYLQTAFVSLGETLQALMRMFV